MMLYDALQGKTFKCSKPNPRNKKLIISKLLKKPEKLESSSEHKLSYLEAIWSYVNDL